MDSRVRDLSFIILGAYMLGRAESFWLLVGAVILWCGLSFLLKEEKDD